jgi:hypothetical protein
MRRALVLAVVSLLVALVGAGSARAEPVSIDFESGIPGELVTNQYGPPGTPAGPVFMKGEEAGFGHKLDCGPPELDGEDPASSGTHTIKLDGCPGLEFGPSAAFFQLGWPADRVEFEVGLKGGTPSFCTVCAQIWTTAFNAKREIVAQEQTLIGPSVKFKPAVIESSKGDIAFVAIEEGSKEPEDPESPTHVSLPAATTLLVDDLTYDKPSSPPESEFVLGATPASTSTVAGDHVAIKIPVTWFANPEPSKSPVTFEVATPAGVEGSFSATTTTTGSTTLTLNVAKNAELGPKKIVVTGYVEKGKAGEKHSSVEITLGVSAPFEVSSPGPVTVAPCTPRQVQLRVVAASDFSEPLTLDVVTNNQPAVTITGISGGEVLSAHHARTSVIQHGGEATATLTLGVAPGTPAAGPRTWSVEASASGYASQFATGTLAIEAGHVSQATSNGVPASTVSTPELGIPGSQLTLTGAGFCPGTKVAVGDPDNPATPESIASDGSSLSLRVPRGASTGPIHVLPPAGAGFDGPSLTVRSFRNTFGFSWKNGDYGLRLNEALIDELFGQDETNINVFGWLVRKPEAYEFETITNKHIPGGICFGIAYSSLEFRDFPGEVFSFPRTGGNDAWHMDSSGAPSSSLLQLVTERFSLQFTDQLIPAEVNAVLGIHGTDDDINEIKAGLATGEPVIVGLIHWNGPSIEGHTVLAYDTHPLPDGSTAVDVANSNVPYMTSEEGDPAAHDAAEFTNSQVIVKNGNWIFPEGADFSGSNGQPWSGSEADMVVYKHSELPIVNGHRPKLPNVFTGAVMVAFGSAGDGVTQLSDGHGSLFTGGHLAPQGSWPKGVAPIADFTGHPGPLQLVSFNPHAAGPLNATVNRAAGGGTMNLNLPGLQANLQSGTHAGQADHITVNPHSDAIGYQTSSPRAALSGTLLSAPGAAAGARASAATRASAAATSALADRVVQFSTTASRGGGEQLAFPSGRGFVLHHTGAPASLSLTLSAFGAGGQPVAVKLPAVRLRAGETLRVTPRNWRALGASPVLISATVHGHTTTRRVRGHMTGRRYATVRRASLAPLSGGRYRVDLSLGVRHPPRQAWVSVAATVLRGRHALEQAKPIQLRGATLSAGTARLTLPKPLSPGRYSLRVRLLEASPSGPVQGSRIVSRTFVVRAGKKR